MPQWLLILQLVMPMLAQLLPLAEQLATEIAQATDPAVKAVLQPILDQHQNAVGNLLGQTTSALRAS
jgi:hypothetical protein